MNSTHSPKRAEAGAVIGGCELVRRIGRGGMAEVWVARRAVGKKGSKFVGIKLMADHYVGDDRYRRMFRSEAELAAVLSHANIVQVFDEGEEDGRSFLVMEWVDGLNLLKLGAALALLGDEQRRFRLIAYIIGQLLHALHYAHSITAADGNPLGVVHRDVSPQNVLVSNHGEVKLTDFGVAYHAFEESSGIHVKGKVRYMAPEQLGGKTRSPTVDLYAVGALLHELLDGRRFRGEHEDGQDLLAAVLVGAVSPLSRPVPHELDRLRLGLLEPNPARRIQTAEQAFALLEQYPGYGDARHELSRLCGSFTGVVRPRAGLERSSQGVVAAQEGEAQWSGGRGRPRSKLHVAAESPPPSLGSAAPVGSWSAVKDAPQARPWANRSITGRTVIGWPGPLLERIASAAPSPRAAPSASPQATTGSSGGWIEALEPTWSAPSPWPSQPEPVKSGDTLVAEIDSNSETEQLLTAMPRGNEITATRPEVTTRPPARARRAHRGRSWYWAVPIGLTLAMVMAMTGAWWLLERGDAATHTGSEREASEPLEAKTVEPLAAAASVRAKSQPSNDGASHSTDQTERRSEDRSERKSEDQSERRTEREPEDQAEHRGKDRTERRTEDQSERRGKTRTERRTGDQSEHQGENQLEALEPAPPHPTDRVRPAPPKPNRTTKPPAKAVPKVLLKVRGSVDLTGAQVRVASRTLTVGDFRDVLVPAGRRALEWRAHEHEAWKPGGSWKFEPGTTVMAFVTADGLEVRTLP